MKLRRRSYLSEKKLVIRTLVPDFELSDTELVQRVKSYGKDKQSSYGLFVKARSLKPDIDMKEFSAIWDAVAPDPHRRQKSVDFVPTHRSKANKDITIMVTARTPHVVTYVLSYGGTGGDPAGMFDQGYVPIKGAR